MPGADDLVRQDGSPLVRQPKVLALKQPVSSKPFHPNFIQNLSKLTGCAVIVIPFDHEILMGKVAAENLESLHSGIHAIFNLPAGNFSTEELKVISCAIDYVIRNCDPGPDSTEVKLADKIGKLLPDVQ